MREESAGTDTSCGSSIELEQERLLEVYSDSELEEEVDDGERRSLTFIVGSLCDVIDVIK